MELGSSSSKTNLDPKSNLKEELSDPETNKKYKEIMSTIPRWKGMWVKDLYQYEGFWCGAHSLEGILSAQDRFKPHPNDIFLSIAPKSGTTWLKALSFAIITRSHFDESTNPLLIGLAHDLVRFLESKFAQTLKSWILMFHLWLHTFPTLPYQNPL